MAFRSSILGVIAIGLLSALAARAQPVISVQPQGQTAPLGAVVTLSVTASSSLTIGYQWQFNGVAIDGQTSSTLNLGDATTAEAGVYTVYVYDSNGGVTSSPATLTVNDGPVIQSGSVSAYAYTYPFRYVIPVGNSAATFSATGLPPGLSLDPAAGVISGTPSATGVYPVSLTASNSGGSTTATLAITVTPPPYAYAGLGVTGISFSNAAGLVRFQGGYYVADAGKNTLVAVNPGTGVATAFVGSPGVAGAADGTGASATFNGPTGLAVDSGGNLYVADTGNSTIRMVTAQGVVTTLAGTPGEPGAQDGTGTAAHFNYPTAVAADASGNVFVLDTGNRTVRKIAPGGVVTTLAGGAGGSIPIDGQGTAANFVYPQAMAIGPDGSLYVIDNESSRNLLRKVTPAGLVSTINVSNLGNGSTANLAVDSSGNVYCMVESGTYDPPVELLEVTASGAEVNLGPISESFAPQPNAIAIDPSGTIYAAGSSGLGILQVSQGPTIQTQPQSVVALAGKVALISIEATANPALNLGFYPTQGISYQLYFDGGPIPGNLVGPLGGTGLQSFLVNASAATAGTYSILVTGPFGGTVMSDSVTLTIEPDVSIAAQPSSVSVAAGSPATFTVATTGGISPTYQWTFNGAPITGATGPSYTVASAEASASGAYAVTVTDVSGTLASEPAFLTVTAASGGPALAFQPASLEVSPGQTVVLSVGSAPSTPGAQVVAGPTARATAGTTYQWYLNGAAMADSGGISGSTTSTLVLSGAGTQPGSYVCLVENAEGSVLSQPAVLTAAGSADLGHLTNVSCRAQVGTGAGILIAGFAVAGDPSQDAGVLIRASGPALAAFDLTGFLPDPGLQLYDITGGSVLVASDAGWAGSSAVASASAAVGAFAWTNAASSDSALLENLPPGSYTANISGASNDTGVALAEVYDTTPDDGISDAHPQLVNISARVNVGTGGNVLIAGFVIGGSTSETVLIRGAGPALAQFGVPGLLPDPELQLFRSNPDGTSTLVAADTGWGGDPRIASAAQTAGAFSWGSSATPDSAVLATLPPGNYTAQVSGASGDTGVALVEVYALP
ncbi:MAG TPA: putative Ig domain-containing protein [Opitutaceae bacterium]|jgi:sugar lactone lactonase YvrE